MKRKVLAVALCLFVSMGILSACGASGNLQEEEANESDDSLITVGFSQVGAESDWRTACTNSIMAAFSEEEGYNLIFSDAQQKQDNQIKAVRDFISQDVDYIIIDPITESGWDQALSEAKDAGIPVIIVDRMVDADESLYTAAVGSDFKLEGQKACEYLNLYLKKTGYSGDVNIVDIQGTMGASATIGRSAAFDEAAKKYGWNVLAQETGEFTQAKGQEVMEAILKRHSNVNVVYCENDNEAFGARDAIEAAGKKVGYDIAAGDVLILSFDTTMAGLTETLGGTILVNTECNPLYGEILSSMVRSLENGETLEKHRFIQENQYSALEEVKNVTVDGTVYPVTILTQEILDERPY